MAGNVVSNVKKYYGGQVPVPGQGDSDGKVKMLVEKTANIEIEGVQTEVELLYDADDLTTPVTPQQLGQWTDENYLIAFKTKDDEWHVRGFILYALETDSTSTDTLVNRATFVNFKGDMTDPGASAFEFAIVEDSSTLSRYLRDENGELIVKFNQASVEAGAQSGTLDNLIATDSTYMDFEVVHDENGNAYLNLNTESLDETIDNILEDVNYIVDALNELPSDEHGYFNSSLIQTPGDGTTENIVIDDFRISQGRDVHGESIEFVPTHQEGGIDFGEVYLEPGTYILAIQYTLQWVGNPRGTFLPKVCSVADQPFDFSYEHEDVIRVTRIVTKTTRGKLVTNIAIDADTPSIGIWVKNMEVVQVASYNHPAVVHDTTLTGSGQIGDPLGVTPAAFGKVKDIPTSISQFRAGDVIPVDGPNGPAKMGKDDLLTETAQNALGSIKNLPAKYKGFMALDDADGTGKMDVDTIFSNFAPEFVPSNKPNPTTTIANHPYMYNGSLYIAKVGGYQGPWDASKFRQIDSTSYFSSKSESADRSGYEGTAVQLESSGLVVYNGNWATITNYFGGAIDVSQALGGFVQITSNSQNHSSYFFSKDVPTVNTPVDFCDGYSDYIQIPAGEKRLIKIPEDAKTLFIYMESPGEVYTPSEVSIAKTISEVEYLVGSIENSLFKKVNLVSSGYTILQGKWTNAYSTKYFGGVIDVTSIRGDVVITANDSQRASYFFSTDTPANNVDVEYCRGYSGFVYIEAGEKRLIKIPEDAKTLFVYMESPGVVYTPNEVLLPIAIDKLEKANANLSTEIEQIKKFLLEKVNLVSSGYTISQGKWTNAYSTQYFGGAIDVTYCRKYFVKITANDTNRTGYCFTRDIPSDGANVDFCEGYSGQVYIDAGESDYIKIPEDAKTLFIYMESPGVVYTPNEVLLPVNVGYIDVAQDNVRAQAKNGIIVATWNIGHFSMGVSKNSAITSADYAAKLAAFRTLINDDVKATVVGVEEYSAIFGNDGAKDQPARSKLFYDYGIAYEGVQRNYSCDAIFGDTIIENIVRHEYDCLEDETITHTSLVTAQDYYYIDFDLYIKGVKVKFVVTHLAFDANRPGVLQQKQIEELADKYGSYDYCVIVGDFNVNSESDFAAIDAVGFGRANNGRLITYPGGNKALDDICVKGLSYDDAQMEDCTSLSDHNLIWTTITYEG